MNNQNKTGVSPDFFKNIGGQDMAIYAAVKALKNCQVPYWCKPISAYNNSTPTGYVCLSQALAQKVFPIYAKYSIDTIISDIHNNKLQPLQNYGTVLNANGKIIKYDPALMQGSINMVPKETFLSNISLPASAGSSPACKPCSAASNDTQGPNNAGNGSGNSNTSQLINDAENAAKEHPIIASGGLLLVLFGIATLISSK